MSYFCWHFTDSRIYDLIDNSPSLLVPHHFFFTSAIMWACWVSKRPDWILSLDILLVLIGVSLLLDCPEKIFWCDWIMSANVILAPSPKGNIWYLGMFTGGMWCVAPTNKGSMRATTGLLGWNRLYICTQFGRTWDDWPESKGTFVYNEYSLHHLKN